MEQKQLINEIRKGLLVVAVLQIVSIEKVFAGEILKKLAGTDFSTQEGTLYPMLSRLKREGLITYEWVESPSGPPRKYYSLSDKGETYRKDLLAYLKKTEQNLQKIGGINHAKNNGN